MAVGNEVRLVEFIAQIGEPARGRAGFEHEHVGLLAFDEPGEFAAKSVDGGEVVDFAVGGGVGVVLFVHAGNRLELSEVECENLHGRVQPFYVNRG